MVSLVGVGVLIVLVACMLTIPFGLPGLWIMVGVTALAALGGLFGWGTVAIALTATVIAEAMEFVLLRRISDRFGGSRRAFWGAIAGGLAGLFVGLPIPIGGPIITAFLGTFVGAAVVTLLETRSVRSAGMVGTGTVLARALAAGAKIATGVFIVIVTGLRLAAL